MDIYSIYKITNTINEKIYIGFTNNFERRIVEHTRNSRKLNSHLYYAIKKYGIDKFTFEIIYQSLEGDYLKNAMETYFINLYDSYHSGYNMTLGGDGTLGRLWTDKQKQMISIRNKGQLSNNKGKTYIELYGEEKALEKINKLKKTWIYKESLKPMKIIHKTSRLGRSYNEIFGEEKAKEISEKKRIKMLGDKNHRYGKPGTFTGKKHSPETIALRKGKTFDEIYGVERAKELKEKLSEANTGENNPMYGKVGAMAGRTHTEESKLKMSLSRKGKKLTPQEILICPYCGNASNASNAKRWHFDNCKYKPG
jgi:group I intron endonuclease